MRSNSKYLELECGDPKSKPATFSRFVFPFAYHARAINNSEAEKNRGDKPDLRYVECKTLACRNDQDHHFESRKQYFTRETAEVLFTSTKWLEMENAGWAESSWKEGILFHCRGKTIKVAMLPPRLVLFEWPFDENTKPLKPDAVNGILQTGFLTVDLYFPEAGEDSDKPEFDDLLLINDLFRHFRCPYESHSVLFGDLLSDVPIEYETQSRRKVEDMNSTYRDAYFDRWTQLLKFPADIHNQYYHLNIEPDRDLPYADDKTYVWSAAILCKGAGSLKEAFSNPEWEAHKYGHWIKFLNVDSPEGCASRTHCNVTMFERDWAKERTYHRWEEAGTWYGFNYHSGVMLAPPCDDSFIPFWRHFRHMYFDISLLLFYVRVSLFRFSAELTRITPRSGEFGNNEKNEYSRLRKLFSAFTVRYQFPLLSNQQQAIEMYDLARKHFDVEDLYKEVKEEIDNTNQFLEAKEQTELGRIAIVLAQYGIPVAVVSLIASIFGMSVKDYPLIKWIILLCNNGLTGLTSSSPSVTLFTMCAILTIASIITYKFVRWRINRDNNGSSG